jgi:hypothetical protein
MKEISLECKDKRYRGEQWSLFLDERSGHLDDCDGETRAIFSRIGAEKRIRIPISFGSGKTIRVVTDDEEIIWLYADANAALSLKKWFVGALAMRGAKAIRAVWIKGLLCTLGGLALIAFLILAVLGKIEQVKNIPRYAGTPGVAFEGAVVGACTAGGILLPILGVGWLIQANAASRKRNNRKQ